MQLLVSVFTAILGPAETQKKQSRNHILHVCVKIGLFVSNIISHIIQFEATFHMIWKGNLNRGLKLASVARQPIHIIHIKSHLENLKSEAILWFKCGFYNPYNPDYLFLWLQSGLCGFSALFKPQIISIKATYNPHFITRNAYCWIHELLDPVIC